MPKQLTCLLIFIMALHALKAQQPVQVIKGSVVDKSLKSPLAGSTITLDGSIPFQTIADYKGEFRFEKTPVGRKSMTITHIGYKPLRLSNLLLESGKELVLAIEMEEEASVSKEVVITAKANKARPLNDMALVSARMFSVEETRRFAAGLNDPSRIATAFAGVAGNGDGNALIIRGNAPNGLLWRMEGVDIPNPNHFARVGTSGGAISILSAQLLANSDFMTGAFPAEYGNAVSGVFDIKLRKGNKGKREHTFSISTIGIDAATEGYFKKGYDGSYLVNYRYGFLSLMQKMGFKITDAPTSFQDLSFNIHLPSKKAGQFSIFGFAGLSEQHTTALNDSINWVQQPSSHTGTRDGSNSAMVGIAHQYNFGKKMVLKSVLSLNSTSYFEEDNRYDKINGPLVISRDNRFKESDAIISTVLTIKANRHHLLKLGSYVTFKSFDLQQRELVATVLKDKVKSDGTTRLTNAFIQWKWSPTDRLTLQTGLQYQQFALNGTRVLEPRWGVRYRLADKHFLNAGIGMHSQIQPLGNYFVRIKVGTDTLQPNLSLGFTRSNHYVLGYSYQFADNWNLKLETYYQWLYGIPITFGRATNFSVINMEDDYAIETLVNDGKGINYGMEYTLERWWNDQFYLLATLSLYNSKYQASDGNWRNTRYNLNNAYTLLMGKEWNIKNKQSSTLGIDFKMVHTGGVRVTPIDLYLSRTRRTTVLDNSNLYAQQLPAFFRIDLQAEWKNQYKKRTGSFIIGVQNLTNKKNPVRQQWDANLGAIRYSYLLGRIPVFGFKLDL